MLQKVVQAINAKIKVGCTGCGYCMPCPKNVDIPGIFAAYNRCYSEGKKAAFMEYFMCTGMHITSSAASNCIGCGKCELHYPQHIEIRKELKTPADNRKYQRTRSGGKSCPCSNCIDKIPQYHDLESTIFISVLYFLC